MDDRLRRFLEGKAGVSLSCLPETGVAVHGSPKRTGEPGNRITVQRVAGRDGILVTVAPGSVDAVTRAAQHLAPCEVFSPLGRAELCRALGIDDEPSEHYLYGFDYVLPCSQNFCPAPTRHTTRPLRKQDIPREQFELRMSERRRPTPEDFIWAFACDHDDATFRATELAPYGEQCASVAIAIWRDGPVATYGVATERPCRREGFALAAVSAMTGWILEQGGIPVYGAYANNIASLRIPRRLGFTLLQQQMDI